MNIGPGSIPGGHRIERAHGSGGMGTVHLATHPALPPARRLLAPPRRGPEFRARFDREANRDHPDIVAVHSTVSADARPRRKRLRR
ncbi:hypothetical protein [Nocardia sp. NPDC059239]|uniref:hypothetical protein n=1 Tax=unclassified Nocardia TaxID=2637762 RepID=UPI0036D1BF9C